MPRRNISERRTSASTLCRLAIVAAFAWARAVSFADQPHQTVEQCAAIADDAERLACFDRTVRPDAPVLATKEPRVAPAEGSEMAKEPERAAPKIGSTPPAVLREKIVLDRAEEAPPAEVEEEVEKRGFFGRLFRDRGQREPSVKAPSPPEDAADSAAIAAKVVRVVKLMRGNFQVVLDNGETWRENEYQPGTSYEVGDAVRIRERFMGMHDLTNQRTGQVVRVNRVR